MTSVFMRTAEQGSQAFEGKSRRATHRYAVKTPLRYRIPGGEINTAWKSGETLDMSVDGIFIDTPEAAPVGTELELEIDWPGLYHGKPMGRLLVIRSDVRTDGPGSALPILNPPLRYLPPPQPP